MTDELEEISLASMFWPAIVASALPMSMGFVGLFLCFFPTNIGRQFYQEYFISMPIALCFALGTPIVAWLSCRNLIHNAPDENANLFKLLGVGPVAVKYSFFIHAFACLTHIFVFYIFFGGGEIIGVIFWFGFLINAVLFVVITMPLSVFCAAIFALLYSAPNDSSS